MRRLEVDGLNVAFVKYGGLVPAAYLDVLLDIPADGRLYGGLARKTTDHNKDYYTISREYSDTSAMEHLHQFLENQQLNFFERCVTYPATCLSSSASRRKDNKRSS